MNKMLWIALFVFAMTFFISPCVFAQADDDEDSLLTQDIRAKKYDETMMKGKEALKERRFKEAINYFEIAAQMNPNSYEAHNYLGEVYDKLNDPVKAARHYQKAAELIRTAQIGEDMTGEKLRNLTFFSSPIADGRNSMMHSTVGVPRLEGARTLPKEHLIFMSNLEITQTNFSKTEEGGKNIYNSRLYEWSLEGTYGVTNEMELWGKATIGFLSEIDKDVLIWNDNIQIVPQGQRSIGPSDIYLGIKYQPMSMRGDDEFSGFAFATSFKVPLASDEDMLSSGTVDWSANFIGSKRFDRLVFHLNIGYTFMFRSQSILASTVDFNDFVSYGVGGVYMMSDNMSIIAQVEGNSSAFSSSIPVLGSSANTLIVGMKYRLRNDWLLQMGAGTGFGDQSSDFIALFGIGRHF